MQSKHYMVVHGMSHGAWCWYKLKPLLESAGHRVTALDMGASGVNMRPVEELRSFRDYNAPLLSFMSSLPEDDKVVLVGHSLGGINIAFAMEEFPEKVSAAVFVAALVPDTVNKPSFFLDELFKKIGAANGWLDCQFSTFGSPDEPVTVISFGPKFLSLLYDSSPIEDYELAKMLTRPLPNYVTDLGKAEKLSDGKYGSVRRVYVICKEDKAIPDELVGQMIEWNGLKEVIELQGADHMPMLSNPQQLCDCLVQIAVENP
uniref:Ethylene esterase-like protein n=1 Tax=Rheum australe TaxID=284363 RepID=B5M1Z2_RHEAU|nr:ethylene esterase-like protein [Rheum australe]